MTNKNFKNDQTVISCNNGNECVLKDDTTTSCMCVLKTDGTGICKAHESNDQVYAKYWSDCGSSNMIDDMDTAAYWMFYMMYWEHTQSTVTCMNIFSETTRLSDLQDAYEGAATLVVGVYIFLALY
jgi:hypothetical protein